MSDDQRLFGGMPVPTSVSSRVTVIAYQGARVYTADAGPALAEGLRLGVMECPAVSLDGAERHAVRIGSTCERDGWRTYAHDLADVAKVDAAAARLRAEGEPGC